MPALAERLRQLMVNRTDKQVFLRGDGELYVQNLIDVLDRVEGSRRRERRHRDGVARPVTRMIETVTDIIVARSREPEGLKTMIVWSIAGAHRARRARVARGRASSRQGAAPR